MSDRSYRGYRIRTSYFSGAWWVERDGRLICYADSVEDAKRQVDGLLEMQGQSRSV